MLGDIGGTFLTRFLQGGLMMWPLLACSLLGLTFIIERVISYRRIKGDTAEIFSAIRELLLAGDLRQSVEVCESFDHPVATTLRSGLLRYGKKQGEIEKAMESVALHELSKLEKGLWILATVANIAPLVGFLGTVTGMIRSFEALAEVGLGNPQAVAGGISEALITTATGLAIGLTVQAAYNYFSNRVSSFSLDMETSSSMLLETFSEIEGEERERESQQTQVV
ncbi:MotA/TolQ/ExbB proton channel family protein [Acidobacteria bacterium AH-259-D05]|nr:MotA/TolQ/ExbB proton channel family protein [Acidobacteria bacterium AH-259-D05]